MYIHTFTCLSIFISVCLLKMVNLHWYFQFQSTTPGFVHIFPVFICYLSLVTVRNLAIITCNMLTHILNLFYVTHLSVLNLLHSVAAPAKFYYPSPLDAYFLTKFPKIPGLMGRWSESWDRWGFSYLLCYYTTCITSFSVRKQKDFHHSPLCIDSANSVLRLFFLFVCLFVFVVFLICFWQHLTSATNFCGEDYLVCKKLKSN